jgi:hypothetical protein
VELGEVEELLSNHGGVRECAVVARASRAGDQQLWAYVVADASSSAAPATLRAHLQEQLPDYMVPSGFLPLEALPRTTTGKVDRRQLAQLETGVAAGEETRYVAPRSQVEFLLAGIFGDVLGVERVGLEDDFFTLGGHSLRATRVISRGREGRGVEVPLRDLFEHPRLREFARDVETARLRGTGLVRPALVRVARDGPEVDPLPLSFAQQRLWFLDQLDPESPAYNMSMPVRVEGELSWSDLGQAWRRWWRVTRCCGRRLSREVLGPCK